MTDNTEYNITYAGKPLIEFSRKELIGLIAKLIKEQEEIITEKHRQFDVLMGREHDR